MNQPHTNSSLKFVGEADFDSQVLQSRSAVLVAFGAPWSKPCRVIDPVLLEVAQTCAGKIKVVKVNADDHPNLSLRFGVQHIPTLLHFQAGQIRGSLIGTASKKAILKLLARPSEAARECHGKWRNSMKAGTSPSLSIERGNRPISSEIPHTPPEAE